MEKKEINKDLITLDCRLGSTDNLSAMIKNFNDCEELFLRKKHRIQKLWELLVLDSGWMDEIVRMNESILSKTAPNNIEIKIMIMQIIEHYELDTINFMVQDTENICYREKITK